jgi:hypothetical protein
MFLEDTPNYCEIARELNRKGIPYRGKSPWYVDAVRNILITAKYNGWLTYAKTSRKLDTKEVKMPASHWLLVPHPSSKLIDDVTFAAVRQRQAKFTRSKSNDQLLGELRAIWAERGRLSSMLIRKTRGATPPASYRQRFGSLMEAYRLIGYDVPIAELVETRRRIQTMRLELLQRLQQMFPGELKVCSRGGRTRNWLQLRTGAKISVRICLRVANVRTVPAWQLRPARGEARWSALVVLMNQDGTRFDEFFVFPSVPDRGAYLSAGSLFLKRGTRLESLEELCKVVKTIRSRRSAPSPASILQSKFF